MDYLISLSHDSIDKYDLIPRKTFFYFDSIQTTWELKILLKIGHKAFVCYVTTNRWLISVNR